MIVTSFHQEGYHQYGKTFIEGFIENWKDETLIVYFEKGIPSNCPKNLRVAYINLYDADDFCKFEELLQKSDPVFRGIMSDPHNPEQQLYNFRFDVNRFFRKVYAVTDAYMNHCKDERLAWLDADIIFTQTLPANFLEKVLPAEYGIAHLNREWLYTEAGFVAFNTRHDIMELFMILYKGVYFNGAFRYLGELHDCYVLDFVMRQIAMPSVNLSINEKSNHPFQESVLGGYMTHLKGPERKENGGLLETDKRKIA